MARVTTYRQLADEIIDAHYGVEPVPEAGITTRFVAERIAQLVAKAAVKSAYGNSNAAEATYANDQFISVFYNRPLLTNDDTGDKYSVMPATPAGLPRMREIAQVSFSGYPNVQCVICQNKDAFVESLLPTLPNSVQLFKIEEGNVVFMNISPLINSTVNMKLVGAVPLTSLLDSNLNVPKDVESEIFSEILNELMVNYKIQPKLIETSEPS